MSVRRQLHPAREPPSEVSDEGRGVLRVTAADQPRGHQLGVSAHRGPCPHVAVAEFAVVFGGHVLCLGVAEGPDFVALEALTRQVPQGHVLVVRAGRTQVHQQLRDRVLGGAGQPHGGADRHALGEAPDDAGSLLGAEAVDHTVHYA